MNRFIGSIGNASIAAIALAAVSWAGPAHAADATVTFNMQVSAKNLDPRVNGLFLSCVINDGAGQFLAVTPSASYVFVTPVSGAFNGPLSAKVVVPEAKVKDAKKWICDVGRRGPNNQFFTGTQDWGHLEGADVASSVFGNF